jgi:hypothetical protein
MRNTSLDSRSLALMNQHRRFRLLILAPQHFLARTDIAIARRRAIRQRCTIEKNAFPAAFEISDVEPQPGPVRD